MRFNWWLYKYFENNYKRENVKLNWNFQQQLHELDRINIQK